MTSLCGFFSIWLFAVFFGLPLSLSTPTSNEYTVRTVYQFPNVGSWLENLAIRPDGSVLATRLDVPELYQITPDSAAGPDPTLVYTFPNATSLIGITEIAGEPDAFAMIVGNFSLVTLESTPGSYSIWKVDFCTGGGDLPSVSKLADIPQASLPNGLISLAPHQHALLVSDSILGNVWRFGLRNGAYSVAIDDPLMKKVNATALEGINGIRLHGPDLFFVNALAPFLARIPIHENGTAAGKSNIIAYGVNRAWIFDDFAVDADGTAYVATGTGNSITRITPSGRAAIVAGNVNSTEIAQPTSLFFGRTPADKRTLYITTGGAQGDPINGTVVVGAQLLALDLEQRHLE